MTTDLGRDISCTTSLRSGRFVTGARLVAEAAFRRLTTPRGMLIGDEEEANYGLDLTELIGATSTKAAAAALEGKIFAELTKDERITDCEVEVTRTVDGPATALEIAVTGLTDAGPFTLKLLASEVTIELLGITAEA